MLRNKEKHLCLKHNNLESPLRLTSLKEWSNMIMICIRETLMLVHSKFNLWENRSLDYCLKKMLETISSQTGLGGQMKMTMCTMQWETSISLITKKEINYCSAMVFSYYLSVLGQRSNRHLLINYGFVLHNNRYDSLRLTLFHHRPIATPVKKEDNSVADMK